MSPKLRASIIIHQVQPYRTYVTNKKAVTESVTAFGGWAHQDLNLGPPDYESGATNQLSYRPYDEIVKNGVQM